MKETASYQEVEALSRWASRVPAFEIESSDPTHTATSVPVNKTINLTMALGIDASTVNSTNVTLTPSVARTVSLHTDGRTIIVDPNTNLATSTDLHCNCDIKCTWAVWFIISSWNTGYYLVYYNIA